jgi:hypothetical protein
VKYGSVVGAGEGEEWGEELVKKEAKKRRRNFWSLNRVMADIHSLPLDIGN